MDDTDLIVGRPYGGCGILFRKSLLTVITRHTSSCRRFCSIPLNIDSYVTLLICVYLPTNYGTSESFDLYLETLSVERFY